MSSGCSSEELEKLKKKKKKKKKKLNTQRVRFAKLKKWSENVAHKVIQKLYSESDPQN